MSEVKGLINYGSTVYLWCWGKGGWLVGWLGEFIKAVRAGMELEKKIYSQFQSINF